MRRMVPPRPDHPQPGAIAGHVPAELLLDGGIDEHPVDPRQRRGEMEQGDDTGRPEGGIDAAPVRLHQARRREILPRGRRKRRLRGEIEVDIGIEPDLVADMPARDGAAPRAGKVADIEIRQSGRLGPGGQELDASDGARRPPEAAFARTDRLEARPLRRKLDRARQAARPRAADDAQRSWCGQVLGQGADRHRGQQAGETEPP